ncbi:MAG: hypothetical protein NUV81_01220 [bacterium]|nr:hypothetical protein [bacterium]
MKRKVIKVGTSAAVIIPKEALLEEGMKIGDIIDVEFLKGVSTSQKRKERIDPSILLYAEECMKEYKGLMKLLSDS